MAPRQGPLAGLGRSPAAARLTGPVPGREKRGQTVPEVAQPRGRRGWLGRRRRGGPWGELGAGDLPVEPRAAGRAPHSGGASGCDAPWTPTSPGQAGSWQGR